MQIIHRAEFFATYRGHFRLPSARVAPIEDLLGFMEADAALTDLREAAYLLATVHHETARTYLPVREAYWLSEDWRRTHLRYYPWYGRGYVQLTWERNYRHAGERIGLDLTTDPDVVMQPQISYLILACGAREGWFTGKRLGDYISAGRADYRGARRIINGVDKADLIAGYARSFEAILRASVHPAADPVTSLAIDLPTLRPPYGGSAAGSVLWSVLADVSLREAGALLLEDHDWGVVEHDIRDFQRRHGLVVDGIVGPQTWAALLAQ